MAKMQNPSSFFSGGGTISGDLELEGRLDLTSIQIGLDSQIVDGATAVGINANATGNLHSAAFGRISEATGGDATAIGTEAKATNRWNTVVGYDAGSQNNGRNIVLIGREATALGDNGVAIGEDAAADGENSTAVGRSTQTLGDDSSAFGQGSTVTGVSSTSVGQGATLDAQNAVSIGTNLSITGDGATGVGSGARATGDSSTSIGFASDASGNNSSAIGKNSESSGDNSVAFGVGAQVTANNSVALGKDVVVTQPDTFSFGNRNINVPKDRSILFPEDSGEATLVDFGISTDLSSNITQSYSFKINGEDIFVIASESDGIGGIRDERAEFPGDIVGSGITIWDSDNQNITLNSLEANTISVDGGNGIKNGTQAVIGQSVSFDVDPLDFTGTFLNVDSQDNIRVSVGKGLVDNGQGAIQFDENEVYSFSKEIEFKRSISVGEFQDIEPTVSEPAAPGSSVARLFVDSASSPPEVKIKDSSGEATTIMTLTQ